MKKIVLGVFLVSALFSCKDKKEKPAAKKAVITKDTVVNAVAAETEVLEDKKFKSDFETLLPKTYRSYDNVNAAASLTEKWMELYEENGKYYLGKANYKIEKGFDECVGDSTLSIVPKNKVLIFMDNPELKVGEIKTLKINKAKVWPKDKVTYRFNNITYTMRGEGKVLSEERVTSDTDKQEVYKQVQDYKLFLTIGNNPEEILLTEQSFNDTFVELLFAGDIDGDGKLDFVFGANRDYEEERLILFLSSKSGNEASVKKVSEIAVQFDC